MLLPDFLADPEYSTVDAHLIESVRNTYKYENYMIRTYVKSGLNGKNIDTSIAVTSIAESERFSYGLMRDVIAEFSCDSVFLWNMRMGLIIITLHLHIVYIVM